MHTHSERPPDGPAVTPREVGDGRYRLDVALTRHGDEGLWSAHDTRLGRGVLVQCHVEPPHSTPAAHRLASAGVPGVAPVLDAGHDVLPGGDRRGFTVHPASTWLPLAQFATAPGVSTAELAGVAAWLLATAEHVRAVCGTSVAFDINHVVVDPRVTTGELPAGECPVQWMPALGSTRPDALPEALDHLAAGVARRTRRRFTAASRAAASVQGRRRAARLFAELAGLDPRALHLSPVTPHHAGPGRRSSDRRPPVGNLPAITRRELTCVSAEASS